MLAKWRLTQEDEMRAGHLIRFALVAGLAGMS
jgi:hypothetical protein